MLSEHYQQLIQRLNRIKYIRLPQELKALISERDFNEIICFLLKKSRIQEIAVGGAARFDKKENKLPRTVNILRNKQGDFICILETKSKLSDNKKRKLPVISGTHKKGKPAWEISGLHDGVAREYFNLVTLITGKDYPVVKREANFSANFDSAYIHNNNLGELFHNFRMQSKQISFYSFKAESDLYRYLEKCKPLSSTKKQKIISQLLRAVKILHDKGFVHQDLKPENILVYKNGNLALTDFSFYAEHEEKKEVVGTIGYHSPEIAYFYSDENTSQHKYYKSWPEPELCEQYLEQYKIEGIERRQFGIPHKANDMWALGIIIYQIHYGCDKRPLSVDEKIKGNPLLSGLLEPFRKKRLTIDEAIALLSESKRKRMMEEIDEPVAKRTRFSMKS